MDSTNRLRGTRTYLVGAMDRVPDAGAGWRERITPPLVERGITVLNPCQKPIDVGVEDDDAREKIEVYKQSGQFERIKEEFGVIRTVDLRCVDVSDFIIASVDLDVHACGTYEEITTANNQKKPVLVWCQQGKHNIPNWLFFMLPHQHIFGDLDGLMEYVQHVDTCPDAVDHHKRWFFFDRNETGAIECVT